MEPAPGDSESDVGLFFCGLLVFPFFAFIVASSEIYISLFGLSERTFGYFFGFNALAIMIGPLTFFLHVPSNFSKNFNNRCFCRNCSCRFLDGLFPPQRSMEPGAAHVVSVILSGLVQAAYQ